MRDLACEHGEALDLERPFVERVERQRPRRPPRIDREERRRHHPSRAWAGVTADDREVDIDVGVRPVAGIEEREALGVVPVQVPDQDRSVERSVAEQRAHLTQAGAGVDQQPGRGVVVVGDGDA